MTLATSPETTGTASPHLSGGARRPGAVQRLARWSTRHRWKALVIWIVFVASAVVGGGAAGTRLLSDSASGTGESGRADRAIDRAGYPADLTERVLIQAPKGERLSDGQARAVAADLRTRLSALPAVDRVGTLVRADDGRSAMLPLVLEVDGATGTAAEDVADTHIEKVLAATAAVARAHPELTVAEMGDVSVNHAINGVVGDDFKRAETLSLPITLGILLLTFGALLAAGVPLLLALSAVGTAIGLSGLVSHLLPVTDSLNSIILLIGMAVGVDYSLFYVRRTREERARGASRREAIDIAATTSGHAVVVSGIAVIVAMAGLLLSGDVVFSSMAVGTMLVVAVAVLGSLTVLPAVLSLLGDKVDRPRVPLVHRLRRHGAGRFWPVVMRVVLAKPLVSLVLAGTAMVALALPALGMRLGESGTGSLPRSIPIMKTYDSMTAAFPQTGFAHTVAIWSDDSKALDKGAVREGVATMVSAAEGSGRFADLGDTQVDFAPNGRTATVDLAMTGDFNTARSKQSLELLRNDLAPALHNRLPGTEVAVTGATAHSLDFTHTLRTHLPLVFTFVLTVTFVVLVLAFRSIVVAGTAIVLNLLSVGAAYGLLVLVFQHGFAAGLLGVRDSGFVIDWLPLFLFVILFGLSMDYHVFVVSRIREAHALGEPTPAAVARGVTASAGVVTSAAVVMVGVFSIFATLSLLEFKQLGIGLAAAVLIDATIVRAVLLPATMTLLGHRNWWLPDFQHFGRRAGGALIPPTWGRTMPQTASYDWLTATHRRRRTRRLIRRSSATVGAALALTAVGATVVNYGIGGHRGGAATAARVCADADHPLRVVAASEIAPTVSAIARVAAGASSCLHVTVTARDAAAVDADIRADRGDRPDVWIPDSSVWTDRPAAPGQGLPPDNVSVAASPVVFAMAPAQARRLRPGGRTPLGFQALLPAASSATLPIRVSLPDPEESAATVAAVIGLRAATAGPGSLGALASVLRGSLRDPGMSQPEVLADLDGAGPLAVAVPEQSVWTHNRTHPAGPLSVAYPPAAAGTGFDYPFVVLASGAAPRHTASRLLGALRSDTGRRMLDAAGFRTPAGAAGPRLAAVPGLAATAPVSSAHAEPKDVAAAARTLDAITKGSRVLVVLDISGSMATAVPAAGATRLDLARQAAMTGLALYPDDTYAGLWVFSTNLAGGRDYRELVPVVRLGRGLDGSSGRERLAQALGDVRVRQHGDTALFDTTLAAVRRLRTGWDPRRVNTVVLLTDGGNDNPHGITLQRLLRTITIEQDPTRPVYVVTIAYGPDSDTGSLAAISRATGAETYRATDPRQIRAVLLEAIGRRACRPGC